MLRFVLRRLAAAVPLLLGVATLTFVLLEAAPGDPIDYWIGDNLVPLEVRANLERADGLDRSPVERYVSWLSSLLRGDLGWSHSRSRPVGEALADALGPTLRLAGAALALHLLAGILLGVVSAARRGRWSDRALTLSSLTLYAMPTFWLGLMAILVLSNELSLFPASSMHSIGIREAGWVRRCADAVWHLVLPASVLGIASAAAMARFVRAGLLQALGEQFIRAARARGAAERRVLFRHALRNALLPVINLLGLSLPILVSGSLVIEVVFAWPGMGRLTYDAVRALDYPVTLAATLLATLMVVLGSLFADLAMAAADPRVRLTGRDGAS